MSQSDPTPAQHTANAADAGPLANVTPIVPSPLPPSMPAPAMPNVIVVQPQQPSSGMSTASMVLGLVSLAFGLLFFLPVTGLILGIAGLRREPAGRGMAIAGVILNGLCVAVWLIVLLAIFGLFATAAGSAAVYGSNQ